MITFETPLMLPKGWQPAPLSSRPVPTMFSPNVTVIDAARYLQDEIEALKLARAIVYSNYEHLTTDRMRKKIGQSTGAAMVLRLGNNEVHLACDKWQDVQHNLYALHLALRNIRLLEELGVASTQRLLSYFANGQAVTPMMEIAENMGLPEWMVYLGLGPSATLEDANAIYRRRAKELAGSEEAMLSLNQAIGAARKHLS